MIIKILKRTADLAIKDMHGGPPEAQLKKLDVPKKTKLYVDQTTRERENAVMMHQTFQKDLYRFRIKTAKEFLRSLKTSSTPISTNPNEPLKINAQVEILIFISQNSEYWNENCLILNRFKALDQLLSLLLKYKIFQAQHPRLICS